MANISYSKSAL